jgi:uncharacterized protein YjbI with pentapeptide repeats
LILVAFQFAFLPYHSHIATWTHRLLILAELAAAFVLWPLVQDARRDFEWTRIWMQLKRTAALPRRLFGPKDRRQQEWVWLRQQAFPLASCVLFVLISMSLATFPGEPHVNLFTAQSLLSVKCERWFHKQFDRVDLRFDRLDLPNVDVVDDEKLAKIEDATSKRNLQAYQGERTHNFRNRDLNCSHLSPADLRRVDLTGARMSGANLFVTALQGASLDSAQLQGASLGGAHLQGVSLGHAQLQGASLDSAELQGAVLRDAQLQGASLRQAQLQGASLARAQLQGAVLYFTQLQGSSLTDAQLQGASLDGARLQGASLDGARLQGADLDKSSMTYSRLSKAYVWRAKNAACHESRVSGHKPDAIIAGISVLGRADDSVPATPDAIAKLIERSVADIAGTNLKEQARQRMRAGLIVNPAKDDTAAIEKVWSDCEQESDKVPLKEFDEKHAALLRDLVCDATEARKAIAGGIVRNWISDTDDRRQFSARLARGLLGLDGKECPATKDLDEPTKERLRSLAAAVSPPAPAPATVPAPLTAPPQ